MTSDRALASLRSALVLLLLICLSSTICVGPTLAEGVPPNGEATRRPIKILFIGDSLAAGYGVKKAEAFPERAGELLRTKGYDVQIINAGISGSVTAEADRRVRWYLKTKPAVLVLELGGNDGLKGTPPKVIKANLARAIDVAQANEMKVMIVGMRIFANLGDEYTKEFEALYPALAREKKVHLMPFLLEGVALHRDLNQPDGKHPNAKGHDVVAHAVAAELEKVLKESSQKGSAP